MLWYNRNILIKDHPLLNKIMFEKGILFIKDLLNRDDEITSCDDLYLVMCVTSHITYNQLTTVLEKEIIRYKTNNMLSYIKDTTWSNKKKINKKIYWSYMQLHKISAELVAT